MGKPVRQIRVWEDTFQRMKRYGEVMEDNPNTIIVKMLDKLDEYEKLPRGEKTFGATDDRDPVGDDGASYDALQPLNGIYAEPPPPITD